VISLDSPFVMTRVGKVVIGSMLGRRGGSWSSVGLVLVPCMAMRKMRQIMVFGATCGRDGGHDLIWVYSAGFCRVAISYALFSSMDFGSSFGSSCVSNHRLCTTISGDPMLTLIRIYHLNNIPVATRVWVKP
jgi:hypothetical protein